MNITEFLEARIGEDEAYAAQAQGEHYGWIDYWRVADTRQGTRTESVIYAHAFRFDPERTLAECAAKRAIIAEHVAEWGSCATCLDGDDGACGDPECCGSPSNIMKHYPCPTVRALAAVYKDHPDYQQEWAA